MKILVINTGSSSIKYELFEMEREEALASGVAERIGEEQGRIIHEKNTRTGVREKRVVEGKIADHLEGFKKIGDLLLEPVNGVVNEKSDIQAVGHRVVHGGETFHETAIIDDQVIQAIKENIPLAPLHNPSNLTGIEVAMNVFPGATQVAVFDTAFHQTIPMAGYLYAVPFDLYVTHRIRRYGFHGTSHAYVAEKAAAYLGRDLNGLDLITIHLGNGASMTALKKGKSVDTTMGMTPLAGLVMGTRSGDVDPALPFFLADHLGMSLKEIDALLNKDSGLKGICGSNDMREVIKKKDAGDDRAGIALDLYTYRIKKFIGAYFAALGSVDAIIFTAGVGENSPYIRERCCTGLRKLGIQVDSEKNQKEGDGVREISAEGSAVKILVVPTDEELRIAQETKKIMESRGSARQKRDI